MSVIAFQVKPVHRIPYLGQRKGQVIPMPEVTPEEKAAFQKVLDVYLAGGPWLRSQTMFELTRRMNYRNHGMIVLDKVIIRHSRENGLTVEAREVVKQPYCPGCGVDIYSSGGRDWDNIFHERPVQTLSCIDGWHSMICTCGAVFKRWGAMPDG